MKHNYQTILCLLLALLFTSQLYAQKYEAENAILAGGAAIQSCSTCSGGISVAQKDGSLTFEVTIPKEGF